MMWSEVLLDHFGQYRHPEWATQYSCSCARPWFLSGKKIGIHASAWLESSMCPVNNAPMVRNQGSPSNTINEYTAGRQDFTRTRRFLMRWSTVSGDFGLCKCGQTGGVCGIETISYPSRIQSVDAKGLKHPTSFM